MTNIIKEQKSKQTGNLIAVKEIIQQHKTRNVRKIQSFLVGEYGISITDRTVRNYRLELKRIEDRQKKEKRIIAKTITAEKKAIRSNVYPQTIRDPAGVSHTVPHDHYGLSIPWGSDSICWSTKDPVWRWSSSGIAYGDKTNKKVPTIWRFPKSREEQWANCEDDRT